MGAGLADQSYHASAIFERVEVLRETMNETVLRTKRLIEASRELEMSSHMRRVSALRKLDAAQEAVRASISLTR